MFGLDAIMVSFIAQGTVLLAVTLVFSRFLQELAVVPGAWQGETSAWYAPAEPLAWAFCLGVGLLCWLAWRRYRAPVSPRNGVQVPVVTGLAWRLAVVLGLAHLTLLLCNLADLRAGAGGTPGSAGQLETLLTDGVTVMLIVLLICIELSILLLLRLQRPRPALSDPEAVSYKLMRPAIFLFLFGIDMSMAFLPLHMEHLYQPLFGLSRDMVMGLPISVEFLCVGIAIVASGVWGDRRGWREPFFWGLLLTAVGGVYSWLAGDALHFIAARGVVGIGYGLTLLAAQTFVIHCTDSRNKAQGLAHLMAGLYSGSICGAATGAILAERFGYETVFLIGALLVGVVMVYSVTCLSGGAGRVSQPRPCSRSGAGSLTGAICRFMGDRRVLAAILFSSLPASIAAVGFLNYFSPVYLNRLQVPESTIGQVLMLFGLSLTLLGPSIGRMVDASADKRRPILLGCLLGSCAFLAFGFLEGISAATVAVLLLGLSNCFVLPAQSAYVLQQDVTRRLGDGKALGIFRSTSRIGQMLGPVLFAWLLVATDLERGVLYFGLAYLLTALLFPLLAGGRRKSVATGRV